MMKLTDFSNLPSGNIAVGEALRGLSATYPCANAWLEKTLKSTSSDVRRLVFTTNQNKIVGLVIAKKKFERSSKICTFIVLPAFRSLGFGSTMMTMYLDECLRTGIDRVHITHSENSLPRFKEFLIKIGFSEHVLCQGRYMEGDHEVVSAINVCESSVQGRLGIDGLDRRI
jgi:ribosomal protein S18 acetylase RimI-like enzyme